MTTSVEGVGIPKLFVRQASGLVREFSARDTFVFNVVGYSLGLVLAVTPTFLGGLYPNASIYLVLTLGTILSVFNGLTYGLFAAAMPRSGGDYVYISRTIHPAVGFVANWGFSWSQFLGIGVYTGWCVSTALSPALTTFGYATEHHRLVTLGASLGQPVMIWAVGTVLLGSVLVVSLAGIRILKRLLNVLFVVALLGTFTTLYVLLGSSHEQFVAAFNSFMATQAKLPDGYNAIIAMARDHGLRTGQPTDILSAILALPVGYWVFIGFTYSVYVGGEVKEPQRSQSLAIVGSLLFGYVLYMVTLGGYYAVVGRDFNNAVAIVQNLGSSPLVAGGSMGFFAGILTKSAFLNLLMSVSTFLWYYLLLFVMSAICVRNIFAWSFDRIMPESLTLLTRGTGAPGVATVVILVLGELFLTLHAFAGIAFINYIALFSVCFLVTGLAAIVFPYRRTQLFAAAPPIVRKTIAGIPLITIAGIGDVLLFSIVLYSALTNPGVSGVQGSLPVFILLTIYGLGVIVYYTALAIRRSEGVDFNLLYREIPPE